MFVFSLLGNKSTNMWLIHTFFCYYFYEIAKGVTYSGNAIIALTILVVITYLASCAVEWFWEGGNKVWCKLKCMVKKEV